jgi:8-oxoguanine deaminase
MVLSSGICPITQLTKANVTIGLGVDGSASNDHSNLAQEMRQAYLLQRLTNPEYSHLDALAMATSGGAGLLHRPELGHLRPGAAADVAMFSTRELRFSGAQDELAALLISGAHKAQHVLVNGQWRVRHGELVDVDLDALMHEHNAAAHALWQRAGVA